MKNEKSSLITLFPDFLEVKLAMENIDFTFFIVDLFTHPTSANIHKTPAHNHSWHEIHIVEKGEKTINVDKKEYVTRKNELFYIPPHLYHTTIITKPDTLCYAIGLEFVKNNIKHAKNFYDLFSQVIFSDGCLKVKNCYSLVNSIRNVFSCSEKDSIMFQNRLNTTLSMFVFNLYDKFESLRSKNSSEKKCFNLYRDFDNKKQILDFVLNHPENNITLSMLSQKMYIDKKQINHIMKKNYNMTFKQKEIQMRIENAKRYLVESEMPIDKIAMLVGYSNITSFYKAFSKSEGCTPAEYRHQNTAH